MPLTSFNMIKAPLDEENSCYKHLDPDLAIYVAGHNGMVGSAIVRHLKSNGFTKYNNQISQ